MIIWVFLHDDANLMHSSISILWHNGAGKLILIKHIEVIISQQNVLLDDVNNFINELKKLKKES